ncbi:MAG TPA: adenylate/guanylate cyclase domain-containing protein, partial [Candidatus Baltobacteraceae bacterium]|nr:adenylate/guanylate cyclase domain-containing protein [Candidatus Baltobacteraceae bacterium]
MRLPTGTVTFLFSDIEGSTVRWDAHREAMQDAVRRHDELMRAAIERNRGFVFKTIGDAFCAAFSSASDGAAAALAAQRALAAEDFSAVQGVRVRMALHTGTAQERDNDYFGPTVNRVARLLAIGHGNQVLLSGICADAVREHLEDGASLRDMGRHRLKDLAEPESVHQLLAPDLPHDFPALRSLDNLRHNVPQQLTSFVGRTAELDELKALLRVHRLVTVVGTGGVGKTRLALHVGADLVDAMEDGVWFAQFAPISDASLVIGEIASVLGLQESLNRPMLETLLTYLKHKRALLILDNCEHLIAEIAKTADTILRNCPDVTILATSREPLHVPGEQAYYLPAFPIPQAVALFAQRATEANERFALTADNEPIVAEVCRQLDGIALAIELAA